MGDGDEVWERAGERVELGVSVAVCVTEGDALPRLAEEEEVALGETEGRREADGVGETKMVRVGSLELLLQAEALEVLLDVEDPVGVAVEVLDARGEALHEAEPVGAEDLVSVTEAVPVRVPREVMLGEPEALHEESAERVKVEPGDPLVEERALGERRAVMEAKDAVEAGVLDSVFVLVELQQGEVEALGQGVGLQESSGLEEALGDCVAEAVVQGEGVSETLELGMPVRVEQGVAVRVEFFTIVALGLIVTLPVLQPETLRVGAALALARLRVGLAEEDAVREPPITAPADPDAVALVVEEGLVEEEEEMDTEDDALTEALRVGLACPVGEAEVLGESDADGAFVAALKLPLGDVVAVLVEEAEKEPEKLGLGERVVLCEVLGEREDLAEPLARVLAEPLRETEALEVRAADQLVDTLVQRVTESDAEKLWEDLGERLVDADMLDLGEAEGLWLALGLRVEEAEKEELGEVRALLVTLAVFVPGAMVKERTVPSVVGDCSTEAKGDREMEGDAELVFEIVELLVPVGVCEEEREVERVMEGLKEAVLWEEGLLLREGLWEEVGVTDTERVPLLDIVVVEVTERVRVSVTVTLGLPVLLRDALGLPELLPPPSSTPPGVCVGVAATVTRVSVDEGEREGLVLAEGEREELCVALLQEEGLRAVEGVRVALLQGEGLRAAEEERVTLLHAVGLSVVERVRAPVGRVAVAVVHAVSVRDAVLHTVCDTVTDRVGDPELHCDCEAAAHGVGLRV